MKRILAIPGEIGRFFWGFINPSRTAGQIPYGRIAIAVQIVGALIFLGYTLTKKNIDLPFAEEPYEVQVIFPDGKGLDPLDGPAAAVAGSPVGKVTEVEFSNGRALATLELDSNVKGKIFADATAALRPASALQNLLVNVDPGTPDAGALPEDQPIEPQNTEAFVAIDELTSVFDTDTQAYTQILITEAVKALKGREGDLRDSLAELGDVTSTATPVANALADRRQLLAQLTANLDTMFATLATRGEQLGTTVEAGSQTLGVTAGRSKELEAVARDLAPVVTEARRALAATGELSRPLAPALERLAPAARYLKPGAKNLRRLLPSANTFLDQLGTLTTEGQIPLQLLVTGTEDLGPKAAGLVPIAKDLSFRTSLMDKYKEGSAQFGDLWSGAYSVADQGGIFGQVSVLKFEAGRAENFGLSAASTRAGPDGVSKLDRMLATALEQRCGLNDESSPLACMLRFGIKGLPPRPITSTADSSASRPGSAGEGTGG